MNAVKEMTVGTPNTGLEAIQNGILDSIARKERKPGQEQIALVDAHIVGTHVRDQMAQVFGVAFLTAKTPEALEALQDLWTKIRDGLAG